MNVLAKWPNKYKLKSGIQIKRTKVQHKIRKEKTMENIDNFQSMVAFIALFLETNVVVLEKPPYTTQTSLAKG